MQQSSHQSRTQNVLMADTKLIGARGAGLMISMVPSPIDQRFARCSCGAIMPQPIGIGKASLVVMVAQRLLRLRSLLPCNYSLPVDLIRITNRLQR